MTHVPLAGQRFVQRRGGCRVDNESFHRFWQSSAIQPAGVAWQLRRGAVQLVAVLGVPDCLFWQCRCVNSARPCGSSIAFPWFHVPLQNEAGVPTREAMHPHFYTSIAEMRNSDHRPVVAGFAVRLRGKAAKAPERAASEATAGAGFEPTVAWPGSPPSKPAGAEAPATAQGAARDGRGDVTSPSGVGLPRIHTDADAAGGGVGFPVARRLNLDDDSAGVAAPGEHGSATTAGSGTAPALSGASPASIAAAATPQASSDPTSPLQGQGSAVSRLCRLLSPRSTARIAPLPSQSPTPAAGASSSSSGGAAARNG